LRGVLIAFELIDVDIDAYEPEALLRMRIATLNINNVNKRLANL
jgi:hypothetical protein